MGGRFLRRMRYLAITAGKRRVPVGGRRGEKTAAGTGRGGNAEVEKKGTSKLTKTGQESATAVRTAHFITPGPSPFSSGKNNSTGGEFENWLDERKAGTFTAGGTTCEHNLQDLGGVGDHGGHVQAVFSIAFRRRSDEEEDGESETG